jgi:hypothetical protein
VWTLLWLVLVLGTVAGGFFLGRRVYRSGKALVIELDRASRTFEELAQVSAELAEQAAALHPVEPVNLEDREAARLRRERVRQMTSAAREMRREARRLVAMRRWMSFSH